jgi:Zn-dependent protease with chaperone function
MMANRHDNDSMFMRVIPNEQINQCQHPRGRTLYGFAAVLVVLLLGAVLRLTWSNTTLTSAISEATTKAYLADRDTPLNEKILGRWTFEESFSYPSLTLYPDGTVLAHGSAAPDMPFRYRLLGSNLLLESFDKSAADPVRHVLLRVESVNDSQMLAKLGDVLVTGQRDMAASSDIVYPIIIADAGLFERIWALYAEHGSFPKFVLVLAGIFALFWLLLYFSYGATQTSGIRITAQQFPRSHAEFTAMAQSLGFTKIPELYLMNGNGVYNAYASCAPGYRQYAIIHAEMLHAFELGGNLESFRAIMGHELGHIRLKHVSFLRSLLLAAFRFVPAVNQLFAGPIGRSMEYEADKVGALFVQAEGMSRALLILLSSDRLVDRVGLDEYRRQTLDYEKPSLILSNALASHPVMPWRIDCLCNHTHGGLVFHSMRFAQYRETHDRPNAKSD